MAQFLLGDHTIYYEVHGTGEPLMLLNGIMMSTISWKPFLKALSSFQVILIDFLDQGQSARATEAYDLSRQVDVVLACMDHLKISSIHLVGISYGGQVAQYVAAKRPNLLASLTLFNTTSYTDETLLRIGQAWNEVAMQGGGEAYYQLTIPSIYSQTYQLEHRDWFIARKAQLIPLFSHPVFLQAMIRLTQSAETHDARGIAHLIKVRTLIVGSSEDNLTPLPMQQQLHQLIKDSEYVILPGVGHASMYEKPNLFVQLVTANAKMVKENIVI
jgi:3-oxoadipate enol-lactonase